MPGHLIIDTMRLRAAVLFSFVLLIGCYNDKEYMLYPETNCTAPVNPSYQTDIAPVINQQCVSCHSGSFASGNVILDSYTEVKKYANNGKLVGTITWTSGFSQMPKNGNKLSSCHIQAIQVWIAAGAANN